MREIHISQITTAVRDLCIKANKQSLLDLRKAIEDDYISKDGLKQALADL